MNLTISKLSKFFIPIFLILLSSCSTAITTKFEKREATILKGDTAVISWDFDNADSVVVSGVEGYYKGKDSIKVSPIKNTTYDIDAYNFYKEHCKMQWDINVMHYSKTGPIIDTDPRNLTTTDEISNYLTGVTKDIDISQIKIVGTKQPIENNTFSVNFLPLDKYGNFISEINFENDTIRKIAINAINSSSQINIQKVFEKITTNSNEEIINFCICIDNSAAAENNEQIYEQIRKLSEKHKLEDDFVLTTFNHNFDGLNTLNKNSDKSFAPFNFAIKEPNGLNATNKSLGKVINSLNDSFSNRRKVLLLITKSSDNSSVLYDEKDLSLHARKNNIPIYVIAIGSSFPTFNLEYLANSTGAKLYLLEENRQDKIADILYEIIFSQKFHYTVDFLTDVAINQDKLDIELTVKNLEKINTQIDRHSIPLKPNKIYSDYQILSLFENENEIPQTYFNAFRTLVEVLDTNKNMVIELVGNALDDTLTDDNKSHSIGLQRAQLIRRQLVKLGANPSQIRVTSEGSYRPLYPFSQKNWQKKYNNRVEVRWLLPEEKPYEIIAGIVETELKAILEVEKYENSGYQAYYQRIIKNQRPAYRILIWGYQTEAQAQKASQTLKQTFKKTFEVK